MAAPTVLIPREFAPASLAFSTLEKNRQGGKQVFVSSAGSKSRIVLQTPVMALPFGVTPYQDAASGTIQSWSLDVSFRGHETDPGIADMLALMRGLDDKIVDVATERSVEWFGKAMSREIVSEFTRKLVKDPANPQYAPTMKIKIPCVNGQETTKFYDENRQLVPLEYVTKGSSVRVIMELSPVWFLNKNLGVTWKALQVAVVSKPRVMEEYAFVENDGQTTGAGEGADADGAAEEM